MQPILPSDETMMPVLLQALADGTSRPLREVFERVGKRCRGAGSLARLYRVARLGFGDGDGGTLSGREIGGYLCPFAGGTLIG